MYIAFPISGGEFVPLTAAGISERTLRTAFHEYFGVGPVLYLTWKFVIL